MVYLEVHSITTHAFQYLSETKYIYMVLSQKQGYEYISDIQLSNRFSLKKSIYICQLLRILETICLQRTVNNKVLFFADFFPPESLK